LRFLNVKRSEETNKECDHANGPEESGENLRVAHGFTVSNGVKNAGNI
jgi:hypothetical protein